MLGDLYRCEGCEALIDKNGEMSLEEYQEERVFADKMHVDHINPVTPLRGWTDATTYAYGIVSRMFVDETGLQYLCNLCHYLKTQYENGERRKFKNERKNS